VVLAILGVGLVGDFIFSQEDVAVVAPAPVRSSGQLVSPDGEWLLEVRESGRVPLSRAVNYYVELVSLAGKPNQLVYFDWFERPEDALFKPEPLGWSPDGKSVYLSALAEKMAPNKMKASKYFQSWYRYGSVISIGLEGGKKVSRDQVNPYHGAYPAGSLGYVVDMLPDQNRALWFNAPKQGGNGSLTLFNPLAGADAKPVLIAQFDFKDTYKFASATLDRYQENVAYVLRRKWRSDRVYVVSANDKTTKEIDYRTLCAKELDEFDAPWPYHLSVEKTALSFDQGIFLKFDAKHKTNVVLRLIDGDSPKCFQE